MTDRQTGRRINQIATRLVVAAAAKFGSRRDPNLSLGQRHVLASERGSERLRGSARRRVRRARVELSRKFPNSVGQHVLLHVALGAESLVAEDALEGSLLCVAAVVNFEGAVAGEGLEAKLTGRVGPRDYLLLARHLEARKAGLVGALVLALLLVLLLVLVLLLLRLLGLRLATGRTSGALGGGSRVGPIRRRHRRAWRPGGRRGCSSCRKRGR